MKQVLMLAVILLGACGDDGSDKIVCEYIPSGLCIDTRGLQVSLDEIEYMVGVLEEQIQFFYPEISNLPEAFKNLEATVTFIDGDLALDCSRVPNSPEGLEVCRNIGGVNYLYHNMFVEYHRCLSWTALGHELLHSVENYYLGVDDARHDTEWFFDQSRNGSGPIHIESRVRNATIYNLPSCSYLFTR